MQKRGKKAAIELSIGTIVIVVLAMSMLILGIILVRNIFSAATDITKMTEDEIKTQVMEMFGKEEKLVLYPGSELIEAPQGEISSFAIAIKNLNTGTSSSAKFSYDLAVNSAEIRQNCQGVTEKDVLGWVKAGKSWTNLEIAPGDVLVKKVRIEIPEGAPLCLVQYSVVVKSDNAPYKSRDMAVQIIAK